MTTASNRPAKRQRWLLALAVVTAVLALGLLVLAASRNLIARALARSWLKGQGVASALEVRELTLTGLKARVRLGDPAAPDLSVDEVDVRYAVTGPWNGEPLEVVTRSVRLVRPQIAVRWDGKRLSYGSMTGLVRDFLSRPANPRHPPPQVVVQDGLVRLQTPYGPLAARADAVVENGALKALQGMIEPARLARNGAILTTDGGPIMATRTGSALKIQAQAPFGDARLGGFVAHDARLSLDASLPADLSAGGPASLTADISATTLGAGESVVRGAILHTRFDGGLRADAGGWRATGRGHAGLNIQALEAAQARATEIAADLDLTNLALNSGASPTWSMTVSGQARAGALARGGAGLSSARLTLAGRMGDEGLDLRGGLNASGAVDSGAAAMLERALAAANPAYGTALSRAARRFTLAAPALRLVGDRRAMTLTAGAPARLTATSGAAIVLSPVEAAPLARTAGGVASGAFELNLKGGGLPEANIRAASWRVAGGGGEAALALQASGDAGPAHGAVVEAHGTLALSNASARFTLADCATVSAKSVALAGQDADAVSARLCPTDTPLITAQGGRWALAGRFEQAGGTLAQAMVRLGHGAGRFALGGGNARLEGSVELAAIQAEDTAAATRFNAVTAEGRLAIAGERIQGRFQAGTAAAGRLANVTLAHDLRTGAGHAAVRADGVAFVKGGLQPASISPLAAFARDAEGKVDFEGRFAWTPRGLTSAGEVATGGLDFKSPMGAVRGVAGTVRLTSLAPLETAPGQTLTVKSIDDAVAPLSDGAAAFQIDAKGLSLASADADAAKGKISLEPMRVAFDDKAGIEGALLLSKVDLGVILAASSLADSVKVEMVVDGRLPFTLGPEGFRFLQGHITAAQPGRISIARSALTGLKSGGANASTGPAVNAVQDLAYQALENLAFETLEADVASQPNGRLGMAFRIKGRFDPPKPQEAVLSLPDVISGKAFQKAIPLPSGTPIDLNLDTSLNFDELMRSLSALWSQDNSAAVQPTRP